MTEPAFTRDQLRLCALRELRLRRNVYPRRVANRRMTAPQADKEIAMMEAIVEALTEPTWLGAKVTHVLCDEMAKRERDTLPLYMTGGPGNAQA